MKRTDIRSVGVVGCGQMGTGIAQVVLQAGYRCVVVEVAASRLEAARRRIEQGLEGAVSRGKLSAEDRNEALQRLEGSTSMDALAECDLAVEAVPEVREVKEEVLREMARRTRPDAILATNTSSLSVTQLMPASGRPDSFAGLHFFNPVPAMKLVEVVETMMVDQEVLDTLEAFSRSLGKETVRCTDRPGFLVNRLLIPYLLDAVRALETGTGSKEDIDTAMKLGCGHPMGPFALMDFIGLDTVDHIAGVLFAEFGESRMISPPLLRRLVYAGKLGCKTGSGFYDYSA